MSMAEPEDMIVPLLREMRAEINSRFDRVDARLDAVEKAQNTFRQAMMGDTLFSKLVTGEFEERIEVLERRLKVIDALEGRIKELEAAK